jgi:tRNA-2-methylthio-N6-dimethylallyladenosine synthase
MEQQKSYCIEAYGCQMNLYDGDLIAGILERSGYRPACRISDADLMVVNTCSVRDHAERRALGRIRELAGLKKRRPQARLVVCGCMAQRMGAELLNQIMGVDLVVGTNQYRHLPDLIRKVDQGRAVSTDSSTELYSEIMPRGRRGPSAFVAVMRGCNNRCSYCIVPHLRGPARSRSLEDIFHEVHALTQAGVREITFLGQNVNAYRSGRYRFADLLQRANDVERLWRVRFTTSHPRDMSDDILKAMAASAKVCRHLHLPLQSGSDRVLRAMRRGYTADQYRAVVDRARELNPGLSITTDLIAGFPTETESDFQQTLEMMRSIQFDDAFTFQYSPRPGTEAAQWPEQVSEAGGHQRLKRLIDLQRHITKSINEAMVGETMEVLVEGPSKRDRAELMGRPENHKVVVFPGDPELVGRLVQIRIVTARAGTARGMLLYPMEVARPLLP